MKRIIFSGLLPDVTEEAVRESLEKVGPVHTVSIIKDGNENAPLVFVEMDISDAQAFQITSRVTDYWHDGHMINARLLLH
jgi:hypothetical protein